MTDVTEYVREGFELGGLGTGRQSFYGRLGWRIWAGPSAVRTPDGERPTPDDDGYIMVLETPTTPPLDRPLRSAATSVRATSGSREDEEGLEREASARSPGRFHRPPRA
jgi:hypothetical protein